MWYFICPRLTMPVVRVRIVGVGVYTPQCSCHPHGVCYTHGEWQPVVHIDGDLQGENVQVPQLCRLHNETRHHTTAHSTQHTVHQSKAK